MPAVSDTSPLLGLSAIGLLDLLQSQFETVYIPQAVLDELKAEANFRGTSAIQQALKNRWLEPREVQNKPLAQAHERWAIPRVQCIILAIVQDAVLSSAGISAFMERE